VNAAIVCVDFADILALTLPRNRHHFDDVLVVTSYADTDTAAVAIDNCAMVYRTGAFTRNGEQFNKFAALEEGLTYYRHCGWLALLDADVIWPHAPLPKLEEGRLYSFDGRRILREGETIPPEEEWEKLPADPTNGPDGCSPHSECMGFTQIFHCNDPALGKPPWHRTDLPTAAIGDSIFQNKWDQALKTWLPGHVLHIGDIASHWCGRGRKAETDRLKHQLWNDYKEPRYG
jgi:hypothetical protein